MHYGGWPLPFSFTYLAKGVQERTKKTSLKSFAIPENLASMNQLPKEFKV
jgi:hypothetical protein